MGITDGKYKLLKRLIAGYSGKAVVVKPNTSKDCKLWAHSHPVANHTSVNEGIWLSSVQKLLANSKAQKPRGLGAQPNGTDLANIKKYKINALIVQANDIQFFYFRKGKLINKANYSIGSTYKLLGFASYKDMEKYIDQLAKKYKISRPKKWYEL